MRADLERGVQSAMYVSYLIAQRNTGQEGVRRRPGGLGKV